MTFKALLLEMVDGRQQAAIKELPEAALPAGEVLIAVDYSSLNYKDGLAITGAGKVVRQFPMIPGIDLAGKVRQSASADFPPDQPVILTGWGVGERYWGGLSQLATAQAAWLTPLPDGLSPQQAMGIGTAGLTAMLCVMALEAHGLTPNRGEVLVTGASGGVGSVAVAVLAHLGYHVVAASGRTESHAYLKQLGAAEIIDRNTLAAPSSRPLESGRWAGAVDTVGGEILAAVLKAMQPQASVAACGNAGGVQLNTTVLPFILRGVNLLGIDSVMCPAEVRRTAWQRLSRELPPARLAEMMQVVPLAQALPLSQAILNGQVRGRVVVDVNA